MQFIEQVKCFCEFTRTHVMAPSAQLLWFRLMNINNSLHWEEEFQIDNNRLLSETGFKSEKTLRGHRNELIALGLIEYCEGTKHIPSTYHINELYRDEEDKQIKIKRSPLKAMCEPEEKPKKRKKAKKRARRTKKSEDITKYREVMEFYVDHRGDMRGIQLNEGPVRQRVKALKKLEREGYTLQDVKQAILIAEQSDFLNGRIANASFVASFDWIIKPQNITKILDGNYENRQSFNQRNTYTQSPSIDDYLSAVGSGQINIDGTLKQDDLFTDFEIELNEDEIFEHEVLELTQ